MSMLRWYAVRTYTKRGLQHQIALRDLRNYIKTTPTKELISHIQRMTDLNALRTLWEAGLTTDLQQAVLRRYEELQTRRRG